MTEDQSLSANAVDATRSVAHTEDMDLPSETDSKQHVLLSRREAVRKLRDALLELNGRNCGISVEIWLHYHFVLTRFQPGLTKNSTVNTVSGRFPRGEPAYLFQAFTRSPC